MPSDISPEHAPSRSSASAGRRLISSDRVRGAAVFGPDGAKLGQIEDVMLDKASGRVAYAIMAYGGFLGAGERRCPLPWSILSYDTGRRGYVAPMSREQLGGAPTLDEPPFDAQDGSAWAAGIHRRHGMPGPFL
jgi:hypothetical protein